MTIEEFSMDAELAPFLRGEILIFDMRMERPHARVSLGADGTLDWATNLGGLADDKANGIAIDSR